MTRLRLLLAALVLALATTTVAQHAMPPKYEVRAVWLTTIKGLDWPHAYTPHQQKAELCHILDQLQAANINTILLQTRVRGTTIYPSAYEPFDVALTGANAQTMGYDPLQYAIEQCHKRGMEIHAWMVTLPIGQASLRGYKHLRNTVPHLIKRIGEDWYLNPEQPATATYLATLASEIVEHYDVDGIHLDYIRYPETWRNASSSTPQQRRNNTTAIVRAIHHAVKKRKPWVKVSCSPVGKYADLPRYSSGGWNARNAVAQDAQQWLAEGIMDQLYPMMYFRNNQFFPFALDWQENAARRTVVPGLGIYFMHPSEGRWTLHDITRQLVFLRQEHMGFAFFRSKFFTDNTKGLYHYVAHRHTPYPALTPPMTWQQSTPPAPPTNVRLKPVLQTNTTCLAWQPAHANDDNVRYNIYASPTLPVDINDVRHLIAIRVAATTLTLPENTQRTPLHYAVTTIDRYGNESLPTPCTNTATNVGNAIPLITTDGKTLPLPKAALTNNRQRLIIADITGKSLHQVDITHEVKALNIRALPEGVYQLYTRTPDNRRKCVALFTVRRIKR